MERPKIKRSDVFKSADEIWGIVEESNKKFAAEHPGFKSEIDPIKARESIRESFLKTVAQYNDIIDD